MEEGGASTGGVDGAERSVHVMTGAGFTGSAVERVTNCPASAALPAVYGDSSEHADDGQRVHDFLYTGATRGRESALAAIDDPDLRARCEAIDLGELGTIGSIVAAEVAYAYDIATDTARILGQNLGRKYPPLGPTEIATTTDLELVGENGIRIVLDAKSGWKHVDDDTPQIRFHALAVQRARGIELVRVGILRVPPDGRLKKPRLVDVDDLDAGAFAHELRETWRRVLAARALVAAGRTPDVTVGDHCEYCASCAACPARVGLARAVLGLDVSTIEDRIAAMTPDEAGALWERYKAGEQLIETIGKSLRVLARREPLRLPDGATLEMVPQTQVRRVMIPDPSGATKIVTFDKATVRGRKRGKVRAA